VQTTEEVIRTTVIENQPVAKPVDQGYGGNTGGYGGQVEMGQRGVAY